MSALQKAEVKTITTPANLLQLAVEQGADLEKLERLMDLQDRWNAEQAKNAYSAAIADFQAELGPIIKTRQAHNSKYADLDDIAQAIRPLLAKHGLSYSFAQEQNEAIIKVACTVRHTSGHSESNSLSAPNDVSGGKNIIQAIASTVTYLRRYTLTGALGITTGNEDTDGGRPDITVEDLISYNELVREWLPTIFSIKESLAAGDFSTAKESWLEMDEQTQRGIWRAPTKGGIFTTVERQMIKSDDFSRA